MGLYTLGYSIYDLVYPAVMQNVREPQDLKKRYGQGSWVIVTGSVNALGQEFVSTFNQQGFNVIMVDSDDVAL